MLIQDSNFQSYVRPMRPCHVSVRGLVSASIVTIVFAFCGFFRSAMASDCDNSNFVTTRGTSFCLRGRPFVPVGVNNHYLTFGSEQEVTRVLDSAVDSGATVVRTFLQPVIGVPGDTAGSTVWDFKSKQESSDLGVHGTYMLYWDAATQRMAINEGANGIERLDRLVVEARKRNLKLSIAFLDFWKYTGGAYQMSAWHGGGDAKMFFFTDQRTRADYKRWVAYVLERVNPLTGIAFKDDPSIFSWELMNEPYAATDILFLKWTAEMSEFVKAIDQHHLLTSGHAGITNEMSDISLPSIDYGSWHGYPLYYKWTTARFAEEIDRFCEIGKRAGKPVILTEFGLARSTGDQAEVYDKWLSTIERNPDCAGWFVWRLVGLQDSGRWPADNYDQFDIREDDGRTWHRIADAARRLKTGRHHGVDD